MVVVGKDGGKPCSPIFLSISLHNQMRDEVVLR